MANFELVVCPNCGYEYPPGTVVVGGEILDPIVESGGQTGHWIRCERSAAFRPDTSVGLFQGLPSSFPS